MDGLTTRFDYGDLSDSEQRYCERQADRVADARKVVAKSAVETGRILSEVRERLANRGNGTFNRWVEERCGITPRHARNFIAAFEVFGGKEWENVFPNFDDSSLFLLASPDAEPARKEARRLAVSGRLITHKIAKKIVEQHKPATETAGYSAHGLPGIGKGGKGSARQRNLDGKLAKLNKQQDRQDEEGSAESEPAGQPADEPGDVGVTADAGPSSEDDEPEATGTVIETTGRVVEVGIDPGSALQMLSRIMAAARKWDDETPEKAATLSHLGSLLAVYGGDEPTLVPTGAVVRDIIECVPRTEIVEPEPTGNEITGEPSAMTFDITPAKRGGCAEWELSQSYLDELQEVFAGVDVLNECRKARLWCSNNKPKRKTAKGMREFLRRWMEKQQNSGGGAGRGMAPRPDRLAGVDEYLAEYGEHAA